MASPFDKPSSLCPVCKFRKKAEGKPRCWICYLHKRRAKQQPKLHKLMLQFESLLFDEKNDPFKRDTRRLYHVARELKIPSKRLQSYLWGYIRHWALPNDVFTIQSWIYKELLERRRASLESPEEPSNRKPAGNA